MVICIGIPFPNLNDMKVKLKMDYLNEKYGKENDGVKGWNWFKGEASVAVNQSLGRLLRSANDYGVMICFGKEFKANKYMLSKWIQNNISFIDLDENKDNYYKKIEDFLTNMKNNEKNQKMIEKEENNLHNQIKEKKDDNKLIKRAKKNQIEKENENENENEMMRFHNNIMENKDNNIKHDDENCQNNSKNQNFNQINQSMINSSGNLKTNALKHEMNGSNLSNSDGGINVKKLNKHIPKQTEKTIYFKEETANQVVDRNELNIIRGIIEVFYSSFTEQSSETLSELICKEIKRKLGGEWFVMVLGPNQNLCFAMSPVSNTNIIKLRIGESRIQIAKLK